MFWVLHIARVSASCLPPCESSTSYVRAVIGHPALPQPSALVKSCLKADRILIPILELGKLRQVRVLEGAVVGLWAGRLAQRVSCGGSALALEDGSTADARGCECFVPLSDRHPRPGRSLLLAPSQDPAANAFDFSWRMACGCSQALKRDGAPPMWSAPEYTHVCMHAHNQNTVTNFLSHSHTQSIKIQSQSLTITHRAPKHNQSLPHYYTHTLPKHSQALSTHICTHLRAVVPSQPLPSLASLPSGPGLR